MTLFGLWNSQLGNNSLGSDLILDYWFDANEYVVDSITSQYIIDSGLAILPNTLANSEGDLILDVNGDYIVTTEDI